MSDDEQLNDVAYEIMEILEPYGPKDALEIVTLVLGSVVICSTKTQLDAINTMKEIVDAVMYTIDEYETRTPCHWEHED
jgi:translation elongation factor EF-Tu-like GTPase